MRSAGGQRSELLALKFSAWTTLNGAHALGMVGQVGELSENSLADLIAIPDSKTKDVTKLCSPHTAR